MTTELAVMAPVDADEVIEDTTEDESQTFICELCSKVSDSARGHNGHVGRMHPERPDLKIKSADGKTTRTRDAKTVKSDVIFDRSVPKGRRIKELKKGIIDGFNPFMLTFVGRTIPAEILYAQIQMVGPKPLVLANELVFDEFQADIIAHGIVEMDGTPFIEMIGRTLGPIIPYFWGLAALVIVGMHGWKCVTITRNLVPVLKGVMETQQNGNAASSNGTNGNGSTARQFV